MCTPLEVRTVSLRRFRSRDSINQLRRSAGKVTKRELGYVRANSTSSLLQNPAIGQTCKPSASVAEASCGTDSAIPPYCGLMCERAWSQEVTLPDPNDARTFGSSRVFNTCLLRTTLRNWFLPSEQQAQRETSVSKNSERAATSVGTSEISFCLPTDQANCRGMERISKRKITASIVCITR